jgi:nicotinamide phosphoribosyltransferase
MIESVASQENWPISTSATTSAAYQAQAKDAMVKAGMDLAMSPFMIHDFSGRGMFGKAASAMSGFGHLAAGSVGTDTIPAVLFAEKYYGADVDKELVGASVNATEHSVTCGALAAFVTELKATGQSRGFTITELANRLGMGIVSDSEYLVAAEFLYYHYLMIEVAPEGNLAVVADTNDFWTTVTKVIPALKEFIMAREGKLVVRPDSGDPVDILCGIPVNTIKSNYVETLEQATMWAWDQIVDDVRGETPHGEMGDMDPQGTFRFNGKDYLITGSIDWNRHDKQYYFIDGHFITSTTEITLTAEQKGLVQCLADTFGGTKTDKGYLVLDEHIGASYGDAITLERQQQINTRLVDKDLAPQVVLGVGSYRFQFVTRDTHGSAMKATNVVLNGVDTPIAKGFLRVDKAADGTLSCAHNVTREEAEGGELKTVFLNGEITRLTTLAKIRQKVQEQI